MPWKSCPKKTKVRGGTFIREEWEVRINPCIQLNWLGGHHLSIVMLRESVGLKVRISETRNFLGKEKYEGGRNTFFGGKDDVQGGGDHNVN